MSRARLVLLVIGVGCALYVAPVASSRAADARQYLDQRSAATITTMSRPFVFARERPSLAVNARDYISIVAIDVNRGGRHELYWYGYDWSTIDHRAEDLPAADAARWLLVADGRPIALQPAAEPPEQVGIARAPLAPPARNARLILFGADRDELSYVAAAGELSLQRADGSDTFFLWRDARTQLRALLERMAR
jgi:hypothetical protein